MTFREFIAQSLAGLEEQLRREDLDAQTFEMRLRGARQFARLLLGEPHSTGEPTTRQGDPTTRRFGGPK